MGTRLFVGNLPYDATEEALRACMEGAGPVARVSVMRDRETGRSRGFAFVDMGSEEGARRAIEQLDGASLAGRRITVKEARPPEEGARPPLRDRREGAPPLSAPRPREGEAAPRVSSWSSDERAPASAAGSGMLPRSPRPAGWGQREGGDQDSPAGGERRGAKRRDGPAKTSDWDRPRRGRPRDMVPPPAKHRLRAWEIEEDEEDLDFDLSDWGGPEPEPEEDVPPGDAAGPEQAP